MRQPGIYICDIQESSALYFDTSYTQLQALMEMHVHLKARLIYLRRFPTYHGSVSATGDR